MDDIRQEIKDYEDETLNSAKNSCCVCICEGPFTKDEKCCWCLPVKCGVKFIAALILVLAVVQFLEIASHATNDKISGWYFAVGAAISVPLLKAFCLTVVFLDRDDFDTRV
jgi:hypothetical protein